MPLGLVLLILVAGIPARSFARTWDVPAHAPTIQAGLDSAAAGDTVSVLCGTYYEYDILMKPGVVLRSADGDPDCVTINASVAGIHHGILCYGATPITVIEGLTITGVYNDLSPGGGVVATGTPQIRNCVFRDNYAAPGGAGIYASGGTTTVSGCTFLRNTSTDVGSGYGAAIRASGTAIIRDSRFVDNQARFGGAVYCDTLVISGCSFLSNTARKDGGAIACRSSVIDSSTFFNNELLGGTGGGYPGGRGGAIDAWGGTHAITGCQFVGNVVRAGYPATYGGAISVELGATVALQRCLIAHSAALGEDGASFGGGLSVSAGVVELTNCTISGGRAALGGGVYLANGATATIDRSIVSFAGQGAAVYCRSVNDQAYLSCSDLFGNAGGDWVGSISGQSGISGNLSADPLFCDTSAVDYRLSSGSPCLTSGTCDTIGAYLACASAPLPGDGQDDKSGMILSISPNPSGGAISCALRGPIPGSASFEIFDASGRLLRKENLLDASGPLRWDGSDSRGSPVPSGVYLLRISDGRHADTRKLTLIR